MRFHSTGEADVAGNRPEGVRCLGRRLGGTGSAKLVDRSPIHQDHSGSGVMVIGHRTSSWTFLLYTHMYHNHP